MTGEPPSQFMPPVLMLGETIERTGHRQQKVILLSMSSEGVGLGFVRGLHADTISQSLFRCGGSVPRHRPPRKVLPMSPVNLLPMFPVHTTDTISPYCSPFLFGQEDVIRRRTNIDPIVPIGGNLHIRYPYIEDLNAVRL